jgi:hypothetical protein
MVWQLYLLGGGGYGDQVLFRGVAMKQELKRMIWSRLHERFPEHLRMLSLNADVKGYLDELVGKVDLTELDNLDSKAAFQRLEELSRELIDGLGTSRYQYVYKTLKEEFPREFKQIRNSGIISYHVMRILEDWGQVFDGEGNWSEDDQSLKHLSIESIQQYLGAKHGWQHL